MYGSPIFLINRPPASCRKIGADQELKTSLEWPNVHMIVLYARSSLVIDYNMHVC